MSVCHNGPGAFSPLFPWLEDELYGSVKLTFKLHENLRHPQPYGPVAVMAAGMHGALVHGSEPLPKRPVGLALLLHDPQSVYVKPQGNHRPRPQPQNPHDPGEALLHILRQILLRRSLQKSQFPAGLKLLRLRKPQPRLLKAQVPPCHHLIPQLVQSPADNGRSPHLQPRRLRELVKISPSLPAHLVKSLGVLYNSFLHLCLLFLSAMSSITTNDHTARHCTGFFNLSLSARRLSDALF